MHSVRPELTKELFLLIVGTSTTYVPKVTGDAVSMGMRVYQDFNKKRN